MYNKKVHIHFVGIGGIGMSGIAKILRSQGYQVSGCDLDIEQRSIQDLLNLGCSIRQGHNNALCKDPSIDILVYSSAVKASNPELIAAQERGIPTIGRALMLAELMRTKYSIAIAGSHGKTTTTSMISHILIEAKKDPTVIVGGHLKNISANAQLGKGEFLVAETDESDKSIQYLKPTLAIITNIDLEHLETYKNLDDIKDTFKKFLNNLPFYGKAIVCIDDPEVRSILPLPHIRTIKYGIEEDADIYARDIELQPNHSIFNVWMKNNLLGKIQINMPGKHNVLNALAATTLALDLEIPFETIAEAFINFKGIDRRFSFNGTYKDAEIFDDYGHHPTEIQNALIIAKRRTKKKIHVIFQPHRYTRTNKLWDNFVELFLKNPVDNLIITDIYPASETPIENINSEKLVQAIKEKNPNYPVFYVPIDNNFEKIIDKLKNNLEKDDLILLQGAGKVNKIAEKLIKLEN